MMELSQHKTASWWQRTKQPFPHILTFGFAPTLACFVLLAIYVCLLYFLFILNFFMKPVFMRIILGPISTAA